MIDVLANDVDPDGDALSITQTTAPTSGVVAVVGNRIRFVPTDAGVVTFTYRVDDGRGGSSIATVRIVVSGIITTTTTTTLVPNP